MNQCIWLIWSKKKNWLQQDFKNKRWGNNDGSLNLTCWFLVCTYLWCSPPAGSSAGHTPRVYPEPLHVYRMGSGTGLQNPMKNFLAWASRGLRPNTYMHTSIRLSHAFTHNECIQSLYFLLVCVFLGSLAYDLYVYDAILCQLCYTHNKLSWLI